MYNRKKQTTKEPDQGGQKLPVDLKKTSSCKCMYTTPFIIILLATH